MAKEVREKSPRQAKSLPQALKRMDFRGLNGTTEVVPFPSHFKWEVFQHSVGPRPSETN
jgi:hypothetical protein